MRDAAADARDVAGERGHSGDDAVAPRRMLRLVGAWKPSVPEADRGGD